MAEKKEAKGVSANGKKPAARRKKKTIRKRAPRLAQNGGPASRLLVVESPTKVRTIRKFVGPEFDVLPSMGHVRDLKKTGAGKLGIDVDNDFEGDYGVLPKKAIAELRKAAAKAKEIYLAPDPDREGEAIAWHIQEILKNSRADKAFYRVSFNEITQRAVQEALASPGRIDQHKVDAQETRRKLDRIVGFTLSGKILWRKVAYGLSAGRVQSVALRLICEREDEIEAFEPKEYWSITAHLEKAGATPGLEAKLHRINGEEAEIADEARAAALAEKIAAGVLRVSRVERKEHRRRPPAPFITSTLQQASSSRLRYGAQRTMRIAQSLYEGVNLGRGTGNVGLITYMRTDSTRLAPESVAAARAYVEAKYGKGYLPAKPHVFGKGKAAQDAHEAIRPTDVRRTPESLRGVLKKPGQLALYTLIWRRFLASQMASAVYDRTSVDISVAQAKESGADEEELLLRASGSVLKFAGFLRVAQEGAASRSEGDAGDAKPSISERDRLLPPLEDGDILSLVCSESAPSGVAAEQHFTQPPPRYTEASLVKELEENGVGRPSTYASILDTLEKRKYVAVGEKQRQFTPSALGQEVHRLLIQGFPEHIDVGFTAKMEESLDNVENGTAPWLPVLRDFYADFEEKVRKAMTDLPDLKKEAQPIGRDCPECGHELVKKFSKNGWFIACPAFPKCKHTENIPDAGAPETDEEIARIEETAPPCAECGAPMRAKKGPFGIYLSCAESPKEHPTIKVLANGKLAVPPKPTGVACPRDGCGGELVELRSHKTGKPFYGCSRFQDLNCKTVLWDPPVAGPCPSCGHPVLTIKTTKKHGSQLVCPQKDCGHKAPCPPDLAEEVRPSEAAARQEASA